MNDPQIFALRVKRKNLGLIQDYSSIIQTLFAIRFSEPPKRDETNVNFVYIPFSWEGEPADNLHEILLNLQCYVDSICKRELDPGSAVGEDSSYDSDFEGDEARSHQDVSRTVSDTLAAEFAEYVSASGIDPSSYSAKVEFGLKLGYSEKLVQAALCRLGPNPTQNELLAELIKLGAQTPKLPDFDIDLDEEVGETVPEDTSGCLRPIIIDGSNVAMSHGNKEVFSCRGIKICVDWFKHRGHREITVFVPKWRKEGSRPDNPVVDQEILLELEKQRIVVFTPSRYVGGKRTICYDDRYILRLAAETDGVVVSNDNYRDLAQESQEFKKIIEERTLMFSFVNDRFMPPDDPLGRSGPTLDNFLRKQPKKGETPPPCPYGRKCTYGNKCKYNHPERGSMPQKSVTEKLLENAKKYLQARGNGPGQVRGKSISLPLSVEEQTRQSAIRKMPLSRTVSGAPGCAFASVRPEFSVDIKSRSEENVMAENSNSLPENRRTIGPAPPQEQSIWKRLEWQYHQPLVGEERTAIGQRFSDPEPFAEDVAGNLHKKLERQLTLNPFEQRVYEVGRNFFGQLPFQKPYLTHENLSRNASAPDPSHPLPLQPNAQAQRPTQILSSSSDPQLNLCPPETAPLSDRFDSNWLTPQPPLMYSQVPMRLPSLSSQSVLPSQQLLSSPSTHPSFESYSKEEARRKLHYHLSAIFPEEYVLAALQMFPNETKPQEICAAILSMFSKM